MAKIAVISDIHSNLQALEAVLMHIDQLACERTYCLGDVVGYGANPNECIDRLRRHDIMSLQGNHDAVVSGQSAGKDFNEFAFEAAMQNREALTAVSRDYLLNMSETIRLGDEALLVHGSPAGRDHYLFGEALVARMSEMVSQVEQTNLCFYGHTHDPSIWGGSELEYDVGVPYAVAENICVMTNPGSVGQPRDGDNRASFVWWDQENMTVQFERVDYDVESACQAIISTGLPPFLGRRLRDGV